MMQFGMRTLLAGVALAALAVWVDVYTVAPSQAVLGGLFGHETVYAEGYSDRRWCAVRISMSKPKVARLLGKPIDVIPTPQSPYGSDEFWRYSTWAENGSQSYHRREIKFRKGRVVAKVAEFHLD